MRIWYTVFVAFNVQYLFFSRFLFIFPFLKSFKYNWCLVSIAIHPSAYLCSLRSILIYFSTISNKIDSPPFIMLFTWLEEPFLRFHFVLVQNFFSIRPVPNTRPNDKFMHEQLMKALPVTHAFFWTACDIWCAHMMTAFKTCNRMHAERRQSAIEHEREREIEREWWGMEFWSFGR